MMKRNKLFIVLKILFIIFGCQNIALAQDDATLGAEAYLTIKTWDSKEKYNAAHFLMVPLYYAYKNNDENLKKKFDEHIKEFLRDKNKNINIMNVNQRLNNFQYLYFLSEYSALSKNEELAKYLLDNISKIWLDIPAWQWKMSPFPNARERILWKLQAGPEVGYRRLIIDEDIFIFGIAANLSKIYPDNSTLKEIKSLALEVFKQRSEFDNQGAWLFDKGSFDNLPTYAYAGYANTNNISTSKPLKNMVSDSSHFFRMPKILLSLQESYPLNSTNYKLYKSYRNGLNQQFLKKVVHVKNNKIYLTNYMDGRNGVFRWEYPSLGKGRGYGPYELTYSFGMGWWIFLTNPKIKSLYKMYYNQINVDNNGCDYLMNSLVNNLKIKRLLNFPQCQFIYNSYLASKLNI